MKGKKRILLFTLAMLLLVGSNGFVLHHVRTNRAAGPDAILTLTERELALPYSGQRDNSGMALRLVCRVLDRDEGRYYTGYGNPEWLDQEKLAALGFDPETYLNSYRDRERTKAPRPLPRQVFLVLDGSMSLHRESLRFSEERLAKAQAELDAAEDKEPFKDDVERAERDLQEERTSRSRLFIVDAGLKQDILRQKYPDRKRFAITPGQVRIFVSDEDNTLEVRGQISGIAVPAISVPLELKRKLNDLIGPEVSQSRGQHAPRFRAQLAYGKSGEPWLMAVAEWEEGEGSP